MCEELATVLARWPEGDRLLLAELLPRLVAGMRSGTAPDAAQGQA